MKSSRKTGLWTAAAVCLLLPACAMAGDILATGGWTRTVDASDLVSGAGSGLNSTYESATDATDLDLSTTLSYRVDVRQNTGTWDAALTLYVKRTSDGSGGGSISGGTAYQQVTTTYLEFFTGSLTRSDVYVQYKVEGVSLDLAPDNYMTTVNFTIIDL